MLIRFAQPFEHRMLVIFDTQQSGTMSDRSPNNLASDRPPPSAIRTLTSIDAPLPERLFDNRANIKVLTSRVSMHLETLQRQDIFKQVDELLDLESWDDDSSLISADSFATLLRFLAADSRVARPALTVSNEGNIVASWFYGTIPEPSVPEDLRVVSSPATDMTRVTVEFLKRDQVRLVASVSKSESEREGLAFEGSVRKVGKMLASLGIEDAYRSPS
jgi:hypothetical protein